MCRCPAQDDHLAKALGGPHHIGGIHRLICGDHDELLHAILLRNTDHVPGAEHIVLHRLGAVVLHQGHMLVGCRVEHHLGPVCTEHLIQLFPIPDAGDLHCQVQLFAIGQPHLLLDVVHVVLVNIQKNQLFRVHPGDLPAQL